MSQHFEIIEEEGAIVQKCPRCKYKSPVVTNGQPAKMSAGMKMHLMRTHNLNFQ